MLLPLSSLHWHHHTLNTVWTVPKSESKKTVVKKESGSLKPQLPTTYRIADISSIGKGFSPHGPCRGLVGTAFDTAPFSKSVNRALHDFIVFIPEWSVVLCILTSWGFLFTSTIPAPRRLKVEGCCNFPSQLRLHNEFQAHLEYNIKLCFKCKQKM